MLKNLSGLLVLAIVGLTTSAWIPLPPTSTARVPVRDPSGIEILGPTPAAAPPIEPKLLQAWTDALLLAETADGLGYPYADTATGTLVVSTTSPAGEQAVSQWTAAGARHSNPKVGILARPGVSVRTRTVSLTFGELEAIKLDATRLAGAGLPDADAIYEAVPDWEQNRIVLTLSRQSGALLNALAARYGPSAVAVRIETRPFVVPQTRTNDQSPFYGGAIIWTGYDGCSSGFSWTDSSTQYMLTAGHCAPNGATTVTTSDANFNYVDTMGTNGAIASGSRENWTTGAGTVLLTGDNVYRGTSR